MTVVHINCQIHLKSTCSGRSLVSKWTLISMKLAHTYSSPPVRDHKSKAHFHSDEKLKELIKEEKVFRLSAMSNAQLNNGTWL